MIAQPGAKTLAVIVDSERKATSFVLVALVILAISKVLYATAGYYFFSDDFLNFIIAKDMGLTWQYLARSAQGEFIPLFRAADWMYFHLFGLAFWPYRLLLAAHQCAVILLVATIGRGRRLGLVAALPILVLLTLTPVFDASFQWWSAATNVLAEALAALMAMWCLADTSPLTTRRTILATVFYSSSMCFFPKGLFAAAILFAIRLFAALERDDRSIVRAGLLAAREIWPIFLAGVGYVAIVVLGHYQSGVTPPSIALFLEYIWHGWNHGLLTGLLGLDQGFFGRVALANLCIGGLVGYSIYKNPNTAILWVGFLIYFLAAFSTIAVNRAVPLGLESSEASRYHADISCFFLALMVLSLSSEWADPDRNLSRRWFIVSLCTSTIGAFHLMGASSRVLPVWFVPGARVSAFIDQVGSSLTQVDSEAKIEDGVVPEWVMPQWTFPLREYHYFLMLYNSQGRVTLNHDANFYFDDSGHLNPRLPR